MTQRSYIDIGGEFPMERGAYGPHGLWLYPNGEHGEPNRTKREAPYSYSPFFVCGDHEAIKNAECCYSDRYALWGDANLKAALEAAGLRGLGCIRPADVPKIAKFIKSYHGEHFELVGVVEWCNVSNGYPCWSFHFKRKDELERKRRVEPLDA